MAKSKLRAGGEKRGRQAPVYSDRGIVLRSYKLGESDKVLRILMRENGKRSAVAKGLRKTTSRFGARLEPLTCAKMLMHVGRSLDIVQQVEIEISNREIREDLDLFLRGTAMAEIVDCVAQEYEPHPELFDLTLAGLQMLKETSGHPNFVLAFFEFRVLALMGFELSVTECPGCASRLDVSDVVFSLHLGGFLCAKCRGRGGDEAGKLIRVGTETGGLLSWMATAKLGVRPGPMPGPAAEKELYLLMDRVMEHWMERQFPSHRVIRDVSGALGGMRAGG